MPPRSDRSQPRHWSVDLDRRPPDPRPCSGSITDHEMQQVERANHRAPARRLHPRPLAAAQQLGPLGRRCSRRRASPRSRPAGPTTPRPSPRPTPTPRSSPTRPSARSPTTSAGHRAARAQAGDRRALLRRAAGADPRRPRAAPRPRWRSIRRRFAACCRCRSRRSSPSSPVLRNPANRNRAVPLTYEQFRYAFANAVSEDEAKELYETFAVPAAGRAAVPGARPPTSTRGPRPRWTRRTPSAGRC